MGGGWIVQAEKLSATAVAPVAANGEVDRKRD